MNIHWIKRYNFWNSSFLTFPHRSFILVDRKSAADERLALSNAQKKWAETLAEGGSLLFMFTITKQFDQRNNNKCQLAQIAKVQLELHKRHPSLRVGLRDFFIFRNVPSHGAENPHLRAEPSTVMAAPEPRIAVRFYSTRNLLFWQDFYSHRKKPAMLPVFRISSILQNASSNL